MLEKCEKRYKTRFKSILSDIFVLYDVNLRYTC